MIVEHSTSLGHFISKFHLCERGMKVYFSTKMEDGYYVNFTFYSQHLEQFFVLSNILNKSYLRFS